MSRRHGIQIAGKLEKGHPFSFQPCQQFPALPAISSLASNFQPCQQFPALPAISSLASNFQPCQHFHRFPSRDELPEVAARCHTVPHGVIRCPAPENDCFLCASTHTPTHTRRPSHPI